MNRSRTWATFAMGACMAATFAVAAATKAEEQADVQEDGAARPLARLYKAAPSAKRRGREGGGLRGLQQLRHEDPRRRAAAAAQGVAVDNAAKTGDRT